MLIQHLDSDQLMSAFGQVAPCGPRRSDKRMRKAATAFFRNTGGHHCSPFAFRQFPEINSFHQLGPSLRSMPLGSSNSEIYARLQEPPRPLIVDRIFLV